MVLTPHFFLSLIAVHLGLMKYWSRSHGMWYLEVSSRSCWLLYPNQVIWPARQKWALNICAFSQQLMYFVISLYLYFTCYLLTVITELVKYFWHFLFVSDWSRSRSFWSRSQCVMVSLTTWSCVAWHISSTHWLNYFNWAVHFLFQC